MIPTARVQRVPLFLRAFREWPRLPSTARINDPSKLARYSSHGMAPVLVPLRSSSEHILIVRAPGARDRHGCRHSTPFIARVLRATRAPGRALFILLRPRVPRAQRPCQLPRHPRFPHSSSVTQAGSLYNPAPAPRWTDRTTQPCEHTHDSPLTDTLAHPRLAVSHQRRDLYRPRQHLSDRASDDAGLWDDRSRDGLGLLGLRYRLCHVSDSRWMAGRSLGSPSGAHHRAPLVVDLYGVDSHGRRILTRESRRHYRSLDARAVLPGAGRSR